MTAPTMDRMRAQAGLRRSIVIHGHFYQPPRDDPWLEEVPRQPGAAPWHDWNEKIERECYRAIVAARVLDGAGRISRVINALEHMSFDVGPTLFEWMERAAPSTYAAILEADRRSVARLGHGNALAQPYHHIILPLASRRDKVTEVRWGVADFVRRFGRHPEGMWLPETAVDDETLDVLAQEGIRFTILAPSQVLHAPPHGAMGEYLTSRGRRIAVGIYDADASHGIAFGRLLTNARVWKAEMLRGMEHDGAPSVLAVATDGETFGHHHHFAEMALAWLLDDLGRTPGVAVTNFAALLAAARARGSEGDTAVLTPVELVEPSSWSCVHGVERWCANCGCRMDANLPPRQQWRAPLRQALEALRERLDDRFAVEGVALFRDPAGALDAYGSVVAADAATRDALVRAHLHPELSDAQQVRARELLEMMRDALRMFTSCAWFFDHLDGLEVAQNLRYAARAIELAGRPGVAMEAALIRALAQARPGEAAADAGPDAAAAALGVELRASDVWARTARPVVSPVARLAAGAGAARELVPEWDAPPTPAFELDVADRRVRLIHRRTGRIETYDVAVAARGIADVYAYVRRLGANGTEPSAQSDASALSGTVPVALAEFSEREAAAVTAAVRSARRRALARRLLGREELRRIAHGDTTLTESATAALAREIPGIESDPSPQRARRAIALVDLIELTGRTIPFDAQTAFARALRTLPPAERPLFARLARRLGFADDFVTAPQPGDPERDAAVALGAGGAE